MSAASLNNKSLQLSELVISNEKYNNATGYVASSATFSSSLTGTSLSAVGSITSSGEIIAPSAAIGSDSTTGNVIFQLGLPSGPLTNFSIGTTTGNPLQISSGITTESIGIINGSSSVSLSCTTSEVLSVDGGINATSTVNAGSFGILGTGGSVSLSCVAPSTLTVTGTVDCDTVYLSTVGGFGTLSVNSSNQLLWNGAVIS